MNIADVLDRAVGASIEGIKTIADISPVVLGKALDAMHRYGIMQITYSGVTGALFLICLLTSYKSFKAADSAKTDPSQAFSVILGVISGVISVILFAVTLTYLYDGLKAYYVPELALIDFIRNEAASRGR